MSLRDHPRRRCKTGHGGLKKQGGEPREVWQQLIFSEPAEVVEVPTQEATYGRPPRTFLFHGPIGDTTMVALDAHADPFTGLREADVRLAKAQWNPSAKARAQVLNAVLMEGAAWETETCELVAAVCQHKAKKFVKKRLGTRAVKKKEVLDN